MNCFRFKRDREDSRISRDEFDVDKNGIGDVAGKERNETNAQSGKGVSDCRDGYRH